MFKTPISQQLAPLILNITGTIELAAGLGLENNTFGTEKGIIQAIEDKHSLTDKSTPAAEYAQKLNYKEYLCLLLYLGDKYYTDMQLMQQNRLSTKNLSHYEFIKNITTSTESAMEKLKSDDEKIIICFKGKKSNNEILTYKSFKDTERYATDHFFSTSEDKRVAKKFMYRTGYDGNESYASSYQILEPDALFVTVIALAKHAVNLSAIAPTPDEKEWLFPPATRFNVRFCGTFNYREHKHSVSTVQAWAALLMHDDLPEYMGEEPYRFKALVELPPAKTQGEQQSDLLKSLCLEANMTNKRSQAALQFSMNRESTFCSTKTEFQLLKKQIAAAGQMRCDLQKKQIYLDQKNSRLNSAIRDEEAQINAYLGKLLSIRRRYSSQTLNQKRHYMGHTTAEELFQAYFKKDSYIFYLPLKEAYAYLDYALQNDRQCTHLFCYLYSKEFAMNNLLVCFRNNSMESKIKILTVLATAPCPSDSNVVAVGTISPCLKDLQSEQDDSPDLLEKRFPLFTVEAWEQLAKFQGAPLQAKDVASILFGHSESTLSSEEVSRLGSIRPGLTLVNKTSSRYLNSAFDRVVVEFNRPKASQALKNVSQNTDTNRVRASLPLEANRGEFLVADCAGSCAPSVRPTFFPPVSHEQKPLNTSSKLSTPVQASLGEAADILMLKQKLQRLTTENCVAKIKISEAREIVENKTKFLSLLQHQSEHLERQSLVESNRVARQDQRQDSEPQFFQARHSTDIDTTPVYEPKRFGL